jgi:hypothetical protein
LTRMRELAIAQTSLRVQRWDADQTLWTARRLGRNVRADNIKISPVEFALAGVRPYDVTLDEDCNLITQAGWVALLGSIAGTSITNKFSATNGRICVGTSATAATYSDTHLGGDSGGGSTTSYCELVSGAPTISTGSTPPTLAFTAVFGTGVANFAWAEFGTDNYTASGVTSQSLGAGYIFINHGISAQGTKASGQTWTATETVTFGYPSGSGTVS